MVVDAQALNKEFAEVKIEFGTLCDWKAFLKMRGVSFQSEEVVKKMKYSKRVIVRRHG